jgi:hypothetical protein
MIEDRMTNSHLMSVAKSLNHDEILDLIRMNRGMMFVRKHSSA